MGDLKPGEFIGQGGYVWEAISIYARAYHEGTARGVTTSEEMPGDADFPAALAALQSLAPDKAESRLAHTEAGERMRAETDITDELLVMHDEYGLAADETLTPDAQALKAAINRIWAELERMCPEALAQLGDPS